MSISHPEAALQGYSHETCPEKYHKATGEHPCRSETPKKLPCSLFKLHSNAGIPPQTNPPSPPLPLPPRKKRCSEAF